MSTSHDHGAARSTQPRGGALPDARRRRHGRGSRGQSGQAMVELALILPILALLAMGAIDLARVFYTYEALANASREGARYWALNPDNLGTAARVAGTQDRVSGELDGTVPLGSVSITTPDASCTTTTRGCPVTVTVTSGFAPVTPLICSLGCTGGEFTVRAAATMVVW